jgi:hypothetical protein
VKSLNYMPNQMFGKGAAIVKFNFACSAKPTLLLNHYVPSSPKNLNIFVFLQIGLKNYERT